MQVHFRQRHAAERIARFASLSSKSCIESSKVCVSFAVLCDDSHEPDSQKIADLRLQRMPRKSEVLSGSRK